MARTATMAATSRRRLRRLTARLLDPAFELVRTRAHSWTPTLARVGRARFIRGLSIRQTAQELRLSMHPVRAMSQAIRAMAAAPHSPAAAVAAPPSREAAA